MRILVTGSRDWDDVRRISSILLGLEDMDGTEKVLVSGHCPTGADYIAESLARDLGWKIELHPAHWDLFGKRAGFIRNSEMVNLGADICLAFIKNGSKGASGTARLAQKAGIKCIIFRDPAE